MATTTEQDFRSPSNLGGRRLRVFDRRRSNRTGSICSEQLGQDEMTAPQSYLIHLLVGLIVVPAIWIGTYAYFPPIQRLSADPHLSRLIPSTVKPGSSATVYTLFTSRRSMHAQVVRELYKQIPGGVIRIELPTSNLTIPKGRNVVDRPINFPCNLSPGTWHLVKHVYYEDFLGRQQLLNTPEITFKVEGTC